MSKELLCRQGTLIVCPKCGTQVAQLKKAIFAEDPITVGLFRPLNGSVIEINMQPVCPKCGTGYIAGRNKSFSIHTSSGWLPNNIE